MHLLELLAALGAAQGILLLLLIAFRFRHHKNLPLGILVLVFSLRLGTIPSWNPAILAAYPWLYPVTAPLPFLFGPLLWWQARELANENDATPPLLWLHFVPYFLEVAAVSYSVVSRSPAQYELFLGSVFAGSPPLWLPLRNGLKVILNIVYIVLAGRIAFGTAMENLDRARRIWLRALVLIPIASLVPFAFVAVYSHASAALADGVTLPFAILAGAMMLLIYSFSFLVLVAPDAAVSGGIPGCRESLVTVPEAECERIGRLVRERLEAGIFRDPELSLGQLAKELHLHPNRLSVAVNHVFNEPFRRLLNTYRLDYFSRKLEEGALEKENILELAFDAGFPSKSTFNRLFKERFGVAPSAYAAALGTGPEREPFTARPLEMHSPRRRNGGSGE
ncbi:MAG: helix-turn-helix transcriptional regulator [Alkalispirochaetaceae bacterium]